MILSRMHRLAYSILLLSAISLGSLFGQDTGGWFRPDPNPTPFAPTPSESLEEPGESFSTFSSPEAASLIAGVTADSITPEIQTLADSLGGDKTRIFLWVRNNIRFTPYWGCKKGAALTLWERTGNDADQSTLLVALLRASGHTARYASTFCMVPNAATPSGIDWTSYMGIDATNSGLVDEYLYNQGVPSGTNWWVDTPTGNWAIIRWWVQVLESSVWVNYDPSFKPSVVTTAAVDILTAAQYTQAGLLTAAAGTATGNYAITGVSDPALQTYLNGKTENLLTSIRTSQPMATVLQAFGGRSQTPLEPASATTLTAAERFPTTIPGWTTVSTTDALPSGLCSTLRLELSTSIGSAVKMDVTLNMYELRGRRLSLVFDGVQASGQARLYLDDEVIATETVPIATGTTANLKTTITHPHPYNQPPVNTTYSRSGRYALVYGFDTSAEILKARFEQLAAYKRAGLADTTREVVTENLNLIGLAWLRQTDLVGNKIYDVANMGRISHHHFGRVGQESSFFIDVDIYQNNDFRRQSTQPVDSWMKPFKAAAFVSSAMEHAVLSQMQSGLGGVSTVKLVALNNAIPKATYLATTANWVSTVRPLLQNYPPNDIAYLNAVFGAGTTSTALVPKDGNIFLNQWHGAGYVAQYSDSNGTSLRMAISGGLNGGKKTENSQVSSTEPLGSNGANPNTVSPVPDGASSFGGDPVNLATGAFTVNAPVSLTLDNRSIPRGLAFTLSYDGNRRLNQDPGVGYGWDFNLNAKLTSRSEMDDALGEGTPEQAAAAFLGARAITDLCGQLTTPKDWLVAQLIAQWMVDATINNAWSLTLDGHAYQFMRKPGGGYLSPVGSTLTLTDGTGGTKEVRERHGNIHRFNAAGKLTSTEDPWGKTANFTYDPTSGRLTKITDAYSRFFTLVWDTVNNRLDYVSDTQSNPARILDLAYDASGHLITITDPEGKADRFDYDAQHRITYHRDHDNRIITFNAAFDAQHRVTQQKGQGLDAQLWRFAYAPGITWVTDPVGAVTQHRFDEKNRPTDHINPLGQRERAVFDGQDQIKEGQTPLGRKSSATYDGNHNLLTSTVSSGGTTPATSTTTLFYDSQQRIQTTTDPLNHVLTHEYDTDADAKHQPTRIYHTVDGQLIQSNFTYYPSGNVETVTDPANNTTTFYYDGQDRLWKTVFPGGAYTEVISRTAAGDPYQIKDAKGHIVTYAYNLRRELTGMTTTVTVEGVVQNISTSRSFDNARNLWTVTNALGRTLTNTYSATGRLLTTRHSALPGVDLVTNQYNTRDLFDRSTNVFGQVTRLEYDNANRPQYAYDPLNHRMETGYDVDGRVTSMTDPLLHASSSVYTDAQRKTTSRNALLQEWTMEGDANGNLWKRTNARGKTWTNLHDPGSRLKSTTSPENRVTQQTWNNRNLVETVTEPSGQLTTLTYDNRGRPDLQTGVDYSLDYGFDDNGNLNSTAETKASVTKTIGRIYDELNRVTQFTNEAGEVLRYVWDANGNLRYLYYPDNKRVEYVYDARDRLESVTDWANRVTTFQWDDGNRLTRITRPNGTYRVLAYDDANRLERIEERLPNLRLIHLERFTFDDANRISNRFVVPLPTAWSEPTDTATYDGDNRLLTFNGGSIPHDLDGNMQGSPLPVGSGTYTWDARNRLTSATRTDLSQVTSYGYDPEGRFNQITTGAQTTRFTVNPHGGPLSQILVSENTTSGAKTRSVYGLGLLYEERPDGSLRYFHYDHLGNTVALTDANALVTARAHYSPYGSLVKTEGDILSTPFLYNGRFGVFTDHATGLLQMRARFYNPRLKRFLNADPAGFGGGWNAYAYADGNPVSLSDPFGLGAIAGNEGGFWQGLKDWFQVGGTQFDSKGKERAVAGAGYPAGSGYIDSNGNYHVSFCMSCHDGTEAGNYNLQQALNANRTSWGAFATEQALQLLAAGITSVTAAELQAIKQGMSLADEMAVLRLAAQGNGNFGVGTASYEEAMRLGRAWVGEGYRVASDGSTLISANELRQFRPPSLKSSSFSTTGVQANFESRSAGTFGMPNNTQWQSNGHLNIKID